MVQGLWHVGFTVRDLERSIVFYRDFLGFELVHRQEGVNAYTRRLVGYPEAHLTVALFTIPGSPPGRSNHQLELIEYVAPRGVAINGAHCNPGVAHLAFAVGDLAELHARLSAEGVDFISPPVAITAGVNTGGFACYLHDPDRIVLEAIQPPARQESSRGMSLH